MEEMETEKRREGWSGENRRGGRKGVGEVGEEGGERRGEQRGG